MKNLNNYITEKILINKDVQVSSDDLETGIHNRDDEVTRDFSKLYHLIHGETGEDDICEYIASMSEFNDDYTEFYYEFNPNKFASILRCIVNYDLISLRKNGKIDIKNSNHPDIAKILNKYNTVDIGKRVYDSIF